MLVVTRKPNQGIKIVLDEQTLQQLLHRVQTTNEPAIIDCTVVGTRGVATRLGFEAPKAVRIVRSELPINAPTKSENVE